jgi:replicative DNA helicase
MNYGELLLSKVVDCNDVNALARFNVTEADFPTQEEKDAYNFIREYASQNRNNAPDYRTVVNEVPNFNYREAVVDSFEYMSKQLKQYSTQVKVMELLQGDASKNFETMQGFDYIDWLTKELDTIKGNANYRTKVGTDLVHDTNDFLAEYQARKKGESFKVWKSAFPTMNDTIGGYYSGNTYTWYGRSGRGKSIFTMVEALEGALQGATVLVWAMEMSKFEWLARAYTYLSAKVELKKHNINGTSYTAGFEANKLAQGKLDEVDEEAFEDFLRNLNTWVKGKIIIRAVDDVDFYTRGCSQLESDILQTKADIVVVDPIYYMDYERNTSNTAGGDVANTSKRIRHIAGHTKAVIHVITQAEEIRETSDEDGNRQLKAPERAEIKKTKAVLEDATNTFGIDSIDGRFLIKIGKGRNGGEGTEIEGTYLPSIGLVKEFTKDELASQFEDFGF